MTTSVDVQYFLKEYSAGRRYFLNLDFEKGEEFIEQVLADAIFDNCYFSADFSKTDFSNAQFINCNLKCCDFSQCNLTNTSFINCSLESAEFKNAKIDGIIFKNCHCYGHVVMLNKSTQELETYKHPLVKELYEHVPEFSKISDHSNDELVYVVYGELSLKLFDEIVTNHETTSFINQCFQFFNLLGDRIDEEIDNLLVVGIYEGLYANKKCNDTAMKLLKRRNKDFYEYWMKNGNIIADF